MREYVVNRPDAGAMRTLLERESDPEGLIVRLAWLAGLSRDEIAALCWEQVSFMDERLELPDRTIPMAGRTAQLLVAFVSKPEKVRVPTWWFPNGMGTGCSPSPSPGWPGRRWTGAGRKMCG